jgi:hypothetical protein
MMSSSTAIGMVSESLQNLLEGEWSIDLEVGVTLLSPDDVGTGSRINLFLYKIQENATLKNMDWQVRRDDPSRLVPPPLALNLFYLMTPYAPKDSLTGNVPAHEILGEAMRVFNEHPIIPDEYLVDGLQDAREQVKIMLKPLDLDELSQVWKTFSQPFRLSVLYEISVVQLDMLPAAERIMAERVRQIGVPGVAAPFQPPVVASMTPAQGAAGTVVRFSGANLQGWRAYVTVMGRRIAEALELTGDSFEATLPNDLPPGFHRIRVDISHIFRRLFFFEVTT